MDGIGPRGAAFALAVCFVPVNFSPDMPGTLPGWGMPYGLVLPGAAATLAVVS